MTVNTRLYLTSPGRGEPVTPFMERGVPQVTTCVLLANKTYLATFYSQNETGGGRLATPKSPLLFDLEINIPVPSNRFASAQSAFSENVGSGLYRALFTNDPARYNRHKNDPYSVYSAAYLLQAIDPTGAWDQLATDTLGKAPPIRLNLTDSKWATDPVVAATVFSTNTPFHLNIYGWIVDTAAGVTNEASNDTNGDYLAIPSEIFGASRISFHEACALKHDYVCGSLLPLWGDDRTRSILIQTIGCGQTLLGNQPSTGPVCFPGEKVCNGVCIPQSQSCPTPA